MNIELKAVGQQAAEALVQEVSRTLAKFDSLPIHVLISSFSKHCIASAKRWMPTIPRAMVGNVWSNKLLALVQAYECVSVHLDHQLLKPKDVLRIKEHQLGLLVYTVNQPKRIESLYEMGCDSVFSDVVSI